jgi:magnesium-transporting ATPase (P-type)
MRNDISKAAMKNRKAITRGSILALIGGGVHIGLAYLLMRAMMRVFHIDDYKGLEFLFERVGTGDEFALSAVSLFLIGVSLVILSIFLFRRSRVAATLLFCFILANLTFSLLSFFLTYIEKETRPGDLFWVEPMNAAPLFLNLFVNLWLLPFFYRAMNASFWYHKGVSEQSVP